MMGARYTAQLHHPLQHLILHLQLTHSLYSKTPSQRCSLPTGDRDVIVTLFVLGMFCQWN